MLKRLKIENLILIKHAELFFQPGFTIITGETGSGKTVLLQALKYISGERTDADSVREGAAKAIIEAEFDPNARTIIENILEQTGISWDVHTPLLLKREISSEGRSRAFINCQMVTLSLLQLIGKQLIDFTDQHAHHTLKDPDQHRKLLDLFGCYPTILESAQHARKQLLEIDERFCALQSEAQARDKKLQEIIASIEEITAANIQNGEEEDIILEHNRLVHMQELMEKTGHLERFLEEPPFALISQAKKIDQLMHQLSVIDPSLQELKVLTHEISMNAQELGRSIASYRSKIDANPKRIEYLEQRLAILDKLRRKYGDPTQHLAELKEYEIKLMSLDVDIECFRLQKEAAECHSIKTAKIRFEARKVAAVELSLEVTKRLQELNIPYAQFSIEVEYHLTEDNVCFYLQANPGQPSSSLGDHASGGELSRVMIALQSAIGDKHPTPTVVFDEIDANIGGETATVIGENFSKLGKKRQVFAITHFPQVASQADHHMRIDKEFGKNETSATIVTLEEKEKAKELLRMLGGKRTKAL